MEVVIEANRKQYSKYCEDWPTEQLPNMAEYAFRKRKFSFAMGTTNKAQVTLSDHHVSDKRENRPRCVTIMEKQRGF